MMPIDFLPEADQEMVETARYYQSLSSGLGYDYLEEVERAVHSLATSPQTWPILEGDFRRRLVKRFPFGIIYRIEPDTILCARRPNMGKKGSAQSKEADSNRAVDIDLPSGESAPY